MGENVSNGLWRDLDEKGRILFTMLPNGVLKSVICGEFSLQETRIILFIIRMSLGFKRDETCYLSLEEFNKATGISKSHLSKVLRKLSTGGIILKGAKNGNRYRYAYNLLGHGIKMKHYRMTYDIDSLGEEEYLIGHLDYKFCKGSDSRKSVIVYKSSGYGKIEKSYIKKDINYDIKKDIPSLAYNYYDIPDEFDSEMTLSNSIFTFAKYIRLYRSRKRDPNELLIYYWVRFVDPNDGTGIIEENERTYNQASMIIQNLKKKDEESVKGALVV